MKAAVLYELNHPVIVEDIEMEGPKEGEIVVKVAATGVCHSCYHAVTGMLDTPFPVVLGDEGAGVVEEIGSGVTLVKPGDHVILSWVPSCGHCIYCSQGYANLCLNARKGGRGNLLDGTTRYKEMQAVKGNRVKVIRSIGGVCSNCIGCIRIDLHHNPRELISPHTSNAVVVRGSENRYHQPEFHTSAGSGRQGQYSPSCGIPQNGLTIMERLGKC